MPVFNVNGNRIGTSGNDILWGRALQLSDGIDNYGDHGPSGDGPHEGWTHRTGTAGDNNIRPNHDDPILQSCRRADGNVLAPLHLGR